MELNRYIRVYDDVLDANLCKNAIDLFRKSEAVIRFQTPQCSILHVTEQAEVQKDANWLAIQNQLVSVCRAIGQQYMIDAECEKYWPKENGLEGFRMHRYAADEGDSFSEHIDVGNYESARRFLGFFMYLNDVEEGGETEFTWTFTKIKPKMGSVLTFPPTWQYPHQGNPPISEDKYIITSYLHYV